jgi:protein involved in polysaccharide export with SLBB domain
MPNVRKKLVFLAFLAAFFLPTIAIQAQTEAPAAPSGGPATYVLGIGDKLRITVFNEPSLSGDFEISSTGIISMPLIGDVQAAQQTVEQVQTTITRKLADGYMKSPHVNLEVLNYRPFFIIGEVMKPGSYNYVNGMAVVNAVALAGGYTYRADKDGITLKHGGVDGKQEEHVNELTIVSPGDVINVPERFF